MKWLRNYELFKESKTYSNKNLLSEMCISMVLLNNEFLDNILDRGLKARYSDNSQIFLTDLKNLLLAKNRLKLGKFVDNKCVVDDEISKVNGLFGEVTFDIEKDWKILVNSRTAARNIIDKLIPDEKLVSDRIKNIFWIGPNKYEDYQEDIVIELTDGRQYSFFLNKNLTSSKTSSFNLFAEELIGSDLDRLFKADYLPRWDKLTQEWVRVIYENANKNIQLHIEKFIDPKRIDSMSYFEYFDIRHSDVRFKHLGEFIRDFDKNILKFQDLMTEIWKKRDICFSDPEKVYKEWTESKIVILNSKILENILTTSLKANFAENIERMEDGFKLASGTVKMKLFKTLVEKIGCLERPLYFLGNNGNVFHMVPSREFFRENYDDLKIKFDYHVNFTVSEEEDNNDFNVKIKLELDDTTLIEMFILVKFSGGEMSGKLSAKHKFELPENFNYLISKKQLGENEE
jgi:hypothetical protein